MTRPPHGPTAGSSCACALPPRGTLSILYTDIHPIPVQHTTKEKNNEKVEEIERKETNREEVGGRGRKETKRDRQGTKPYSFHMGTNVGEVKPTHLSLP